MNIIMNVIISPVVYAKCIYKLDEKLVGKNIAK
jgi:hypothetical protein